MNYQKLLEFFIKENELFSLKKFFKKETNRHENGALILITPNQMIKTRTLDTGKGIGSGYHNDTKFYLDQLLYDNPSEHLQNNQNIFLRMFNENLYLGKNIKSIFIHFPQKIVTNQLVFLKELENEYGEFFKQISLDQINQYSIDEYKDNNRLVAFNDQKGVITSDSLKEAIRYAETALLDDSIDIINENIIIGKQPLKNHILK